MASLSPFPQLCFDEWKFLGTLVSNHLLPSSREQQNCQSNSSGSRRLNRGSCCTPKFSLSFYQYFPHKILWTQDRIRVCSAQDLSLHCWPEIRVGTCTRIFENSLRIPPDTDANLLPIQTPSSETFQTWTPFWYSPTHLQQTFLDGIFKPISDKILSHLQMAYLSPFPQLCFDECKFMGTLVSNNLLPSSHERQSSPI